VLASALLAGRFVLVASLLCSSGISLVARVEDAPGPQASGNPLQPVFSQGSPSELLQHSTPWPMAT